MSLGFPDVCNVVTPAGPIPTPFVNIALSTTAIPNALTVLLSGAPAHNLLTSSVITSGDEAGVGMGVASGTFIGPSRHVKSSVKTFFGTAPATRLTDMTIQNSTNSVGMTITPGQVTVLVLT